jgi:hypothetical protein
MRQEIGGESTNCALWRTEFGRGNLPVIRQTMELIHYFRVIKSIRMSLAGHVTRMGERKDLYRDLVEKHEGKGPLGRPRRRWEDNIKMDLQEVGCGV